MAFKIDKETAKKMYKYQNGFVPVGPGSGMAINGYMELIDANPAKFAGAYHHVTGKEMPVQAATNAVAGKVKVDHKLVKKYIQMKYGEVSPKSMATQIEYYEENPKAYDTVLTYMANAEKMDTFSELKVDPAYVKAYFMHVASMNNHTPPTAKEIADAVKKYKSYPNDYKALVKTVDQNGGVGAEDDFPVTSYKVDPAHIEDWLVSCYYTSDVAVHQELIDMWVERFQENPNAYRKMLLMIGVNVPPVVDTVADANVDINSGVAKLVSGAGRKKVAKATAKTPVVAPAKPLTLSQQVKAIPVNDAGPTVDYNKSDIESIELYQTAGQALKKANKDKDYGTEYSKALTIMRTGSEKSNNGVEYLKRVIKTLDPTWKPWNPKEKVKPGGMHGLPVPTGKLTPTAQSLAATPDAEAKAAALTAKIKAYEAEIARLKKAQATAGAANKKAVRDKESLAGIDPKLLQYFTYIEQNCGDFIKSAQAANKLLYRGQRDSKLPVFVGRPRADREPKDSSVAAQKLADKCLSLMGFKALRSNSIFTSADFNQAEGYGTAYAIFPKNGFDFTWSTKHDDLVMHSTSMLTGHGSSDDDGPYYDWNYVIEDFTYIDSNKSISDVSEWIRDNNYSLSDAKAKSLAQVVAKNPEYTAMRSGLAKWNKLDEDYKEEKVAKQLIETVSAMLAFDDLKLVKGWLSTNTRRKLTKFLAEANELLAASPKDAKTTNKDMEMAKKVIKHMGFTKEDFVAALKSEHEICVLGEYVAVNADMYKKEIKRYFFDTMPNVTGKKSGTPFDNYDDVDTDDDEEDEIKPVKKIKLK